MSCVFRYEPIIYTTSLQTLPTSGVGSASTFVSLQASDIFFLAEDQSWVDPGKIVGACYFWVQKVETEHAQHEEHLKAENDGHIPFPPNYEYLNMRAKPFPWGMNSLFFNPHVRSDFLQSFSRL